MKSTALKVLAAAVAFAAGSALAHGPGFGAGMYGGCGSAMGYGSGMGPAMGHGPGMGYGPGMDERGGMGSGRGMGMDPFAGNLTDEQRAKITALQAQHRTKNRAAMGEMRNEQFKLRDLYLSNKPDAAAIEAQQKKIDALREQMFKQHQAMRSEIDALLTPEQRKERLERGPWWARERSS